MNRKDDNFEISCAASLDEALVLKCAFWLEPTAGVAQWELNPMVTPHALEFIDFDDTKVRVKLKRKFNEHGVAYALCVAAKGPDSRAEQDQDFLVSIDCICQKGNSLPPILDGKMQSK